MKPGKNARKNMARWWSIYGDSDTVFINLLVSKLEEEGKLKLPDALPEIKLGIDFGSQSDDFGVFLRDMRSQEAKMCGLPPSLLVEPKPEPRMSSPMKVAILTGGFSPSIMNARMAGLALSLDRPGVPAFMLPRDNKVEGTPEQEKSERQKYTLLCATNEYKAPEIPRDRFGAPEWPEGTKLVDGRHPDAGEWGKLCFRTACHAPGAFYYNTGTRKHYCRDCAKLINKENMAGTKLLFLAEREGAHQEA